MARPLRIEYEGALYHVTSRGNEGSKIYFDNEDKKYFLSIMDDIYKKHQPILHAYIIMPNHYHFMIETPLANLSRIFHDLNSTYTTYFNRRHKRIGHLFQGRYKGILVEKESYLLELSRYIHLNCIRAKLTDRLEDYPWSSYLSYIGKVPKPKWLEVDWCLSQFGKSRKEAIDGFINFLYDGIQELKSKNPLDNLFGQTILGSKPFIEKAKHLIKDKKIDIDIVGQRQLRLVHSSRDIIKKTATAFDISIEHLTLRRRGYFPRLVAIYLSAKYTPDKLIDIGKLFNINSTAGVSTAVRNFKLSKDHKEKEIFLKLEHELKEG